MKTSSGPEQILPVLNKISREIGLQGLDILLSISYCYNMGNLDQYRA